MPVTIKYLIQFHNSWSLVHPGHLGGREKHKNAVPVGREPGEMFKMAKTE